jgi:hypothetical protein
MGNVPITNIIKAEANQSSPLLNPESTGIYLGGTDKPLSVLTLADWRTKGIGPAYFRVGRLIRYRQADLDAWLETRIKKGA